MQDKYEPVQTAADWVVNLRRDLHAHPELAFEERRTTKLLAELLEGMGLETRTFDTHTGVIGLLRGSSDGPTVALRADIDALPVAELGTPSYRSRIHGKMHACGHDANTAIMAGVARKLANDHDMRACAGNVKFIFQPAEERISGALSMIESGVLENPKVDLLLAGHMSPDLPAGRIGVFHDVGYASSDSFVITITGRGSHGGRPEQGNDPIVAGASLVTLVQSVVSRNIKPTQAGVITIGSFQGGTAGNVIPESVVLTGTIRALDEDIRQLLIRRLREMAQGTAAAYGLECTAEITTGTPVLVTDETASFFVHQIAGDVFGPEQVSFIPPIMGSEDFAFYCMRCPSTIVRLGCSNPGAGITYPLHSAYFDIDERVLGIGVELFSQAALRFLKAGSL
jgi:amidohydrolase